MVMIVGHRGGRDVWPENSLRGFGEAARLAIEAVEFDVHQTEHGELVVIHDPTLDRTTLGRGPVTALTPAERRAVRLRGGGAEPLPLLEEVLELLVPTRLELHVELKVDIRGQPYPGMVARIAGVIAEAGLGERTILTSFSPDILADAKRAAPGLRRLASFNRESVLSFGLEDGLARLVPLVDLLAVEKGVLSTDWDVIVRYFDPEKLGVWTVNDSDELGYWLAQPVRQLTTDRPDLAQGMRP